jgi:hypothetical protein
MDDYVALPNDVVNGLTTVSIAGWINLDAFNSWARVFDFGTGTTNYMFLTTQYSTSAGSNQRLRFAIRTPGVAEQQITWLQGDFDFSGAITLDDFTLFLAGYQNQGSALAGL